MERSPFYFIVKPNKGKRYNNTVEIGGIDLIMSSSIENHKASNRLAVVVSVPINYSGPIKTGDNLIVHHNVFKFYNDTQGRIKSGKSYYKDDLFFIEDDQFFMYGSEGNWKAIEKYCFVEPVSQKKWTISRIGSKEPLMGRLAYGNETLISMGINEGDEVSFTPDSEYEFDIDGRLMYRVFTKDICLKL